MYTASILGIQYFWGSSTTRRIQILKVFIIATEVAFLPLFVFGCFADSDSKGEPIRLTDAVEVAVGDFHSCALRRDGTVVCWGNNSHGQLGIEAEQNTLEAMDPVGITDEKIRGYSRHATVVNGLSRVRHIAAGATHNCALLEDGTVRCWGDSSYGQLGNGDFSLDACEGWPCSRAPVQVKGLDNVVDLFLGERYTCALQENDELSCWGSDVVGFANDLESCDQEPCAVVPVKVPLGQDVIQVIVGYKHICALLADRTLVCWGDNSVGQIGVSNPPYRSVQGVPLFTNLQQPSEISLEQPAEPIKVPGSSVAFKHKTCVRLRDGSLDCWGQDDWGQLGVGDQRDERCWTGPNRSIACSTRPAKVLVDVEVQKYVLAENTGCAISVDGRLYCWGRADSAQLGADAEIADRCNGKNLCSRTPAFIPTKAAIVDAVLGSRYTCGLRNDNEVDCWGWGYLSANQDLSIQIDCSSSQEPCSVERHWSGAPRELIITHFDVLCVLTREGELYCLEDFAVSKRTIRSVPLKVYR